MFNKRAKNRLKLKKRKAAGTCLLIGLADPVFTNSACRVVIGIACHRVVVVHLQISFSGCTLRPQEGNPMICEFKKRC